MKFRQGISEERHSGSWVRRDLELEQGDIEAAALEMGLPFPTLNTLQRFNFARVLTAVMLYSAVLPEWPEAAEPLGIAKAELQQFISQHREA